MKNFFEKIIPFIKARYAPRGARQYFSESGEDIVMNNILRKFGVKKVFYIDIGANDPIFGNNTCLFYRAGGQGVLIEPNPALCQKIENKRPRDVCVNAGVGRSDSEADFFSFPNRSTRSTFSKAQAEAWEKSSGHKAYIQKQKILSLDTIINEYCHGRVPDLVSIDAEGFDEEILLGFNWSKRPKIFCIENQNGNIVPLMQKQGYKLSAQIFQNAIFVDTTL